MRKQIRPGWGRSVVAFMLLLAASCNDGPPAQQRPPSPTRPQHVELAVVIVHGIGNHQPGYSSSFQELLRAKLPTAHFEEVVWSDLGSMLGLRERESADERAAREALEREFDQAVAAARASRTEATEAARIDQESAVARGYLGPIARYEYLSPAERDQIQARVRDVLDWALLNADHTVLIGHSLGSVIGFDVLDRLNATEATRRVDLLCTLGSPLAKFVFLGHAGRSKRRPAIVANWRNIYSPRDVIANALDGPYDGVSDLPIGTSLLPWSAHSAYWSHVDVVADLAAQVDSW